MPTDDRLSTQSNQSQAPKSATSGFSVSGDSQGSEPLTGLPYTGKPYTANPTLLNNKVNNNKITKAAAEQIVGVGRDSNISKRTNEPPSAAAFSISSASVRVCTPAVDPAVDAQALIGDELTPSQLAVVNNKAQVLRKLVDEAQRANLVDDIVWLLLNSTSFSQAGRDFHHKLNTIAKGIRQGQWQSPPKRILVQAQQQRQEIKHHRREHHRLLNEQAHLERLLKHAPTSVATDSLMAQIQAVNAQLNQHQGDSTC